jgi:hypothetical protein
MLRVAQNAQLKMPNGALANQPSGLPNGPNVPPFARVPAAGNNAGC